MIYHINQTFSNYTIIPGRRHKVGMQIPANNEFRWSKVSVSSFWNKYEWTGRPTESDWSRPIIILVCCRPLVADKRHRKCISLSSHSHQQSSVVALLMFSGLSALLFGVCCVASQSMPSRTRFCSFTQKKTSEIHIVLQNTQGWVRKSANGAGLASSVVPVVLHT